jgi:ATP-dependent exoDNAse (exonuclease V) beta subunit
MGIGTLTIYSASAGSGKTHQLAGIYLEKLFRSQHNYRKILAVTFTHKATAEMKSRILDELNRLATGLDSKYLESLVRSTGRNEEQIRYEAGNILFSILHDYSRFSVSTIDSFYQKILRAFARDIGLHSGFSIEIDHTRILSAAIDSVIDSAASDPLVRDWLSTFVRSNIDEGKSWDLKKIITGLSGELFNEKFKLLSDEDKNKLSNKDFLRSYIKDIKSVRSEFRREFRDLGLSCLAIFDDYGLTDDMFYQKGRGVPGFVRLAANGIIRQPNSYVMAVFDDPPKWSSSRMAPQLEEALRSGLESSVRDTLSYYSRNIRLYNSAEQILSNIYILGVLSDVLNYIHLITKDENAFLLSDAGELIYLITEKDQAPFIYEKTGNTFENFMIDEFQDTSAIQWKNFWHLIANSMAQGYDNLVVGDIKQSIYRWRNSDWHTLNDLKRYSDNKRVISRPLNTNYRSCSNIIRFNNALFSVIPRQLDAETSGCDSDTSFGELYSEAEQNDPGRKNGGYIRLEFIENDSEDAWTEIVLNLLPSVIESVQDKGYKPSDIGIIVRDNNEGSAVLKRMIGYRMECPDEKRLKYNYNIISGESLLLAASPVVNFMISVLKVLDNGDDMISRAMMLRYFMLSTGKERVEKIPLLRDELIEISSAVFPGGYLSFLDNLMFLQMWEITEKTIEFFGLGTHSFNVPYLNSFQDLVLNYSSSGKPGISAFLEWWETEGTRKSILLPEQQEAMKVLTIHKSKGLEFRVVILPFISWNLDHKSFHTNILWVTPAEQPFARLGVVPVRYRSDLENSLFADDYFREKHSAYLDNLNLLYVAFTRAEEVLIGFSPSKAGISNRIASVLKNALISVEETNDSPSVFLSSHFDRSSEIFEYGTIPSVAKESSEPDAMTVKQYIVNGNAGSLKLKLHWEDYLMPSKTPLRERINYGKVMHEIFGEIITAEDVGRAVRKKVIDGKIPETEEAEIKNKIQKVLANPVIGKWFEKGNEVFNETSLLLPDSEVKRPDRIIFSNGRVTIIDFKFGSESGSHLRQIGEYKSILGDMGYDVGEACIWYVDTSKIVSV